MKRALFLTDPHCGSQWGITPPPWQIHFERFHHVYAAQQEMWKHAERMHKKYRGVDVLAMLGDAIDGNGWRSKGTEAITTDREEQTEMARQFLDPFEAKKIVMVFGTAYHAGEGEDFERVLAKAMGAEIHSHAFLDIEGTIFDVKHHVGSSSVPYGKGTPIKKAQVLNALNSLYDEEPLAKVIVRGHAHEYIAVDDEQYLAIVLPALQSPNTKFGKRICQGRTSWGCVHFKCRKGGYTWAKDIQTLKSTKAGVIKL